MDPAARAIKEVDLALAHLRQDNASFGPAEIAEDTQHPPGQRTHYFHYNLTANQEPQPYGVEEFVSRFVEDLAEAGFVPSRLWTDIAVENHDTSFTVVLTSAENKQSPRWALELECYVPSRASGYSNANLYPATLEGSIIEGEQAVRELLAKHDKNKWDEEARKVLSAIRLATGNQPDKLARLYHAMEEQDQGVLKVWRTQLQASALDEQTPDAGSPAPRPRF